jgi:hypothetical protein
MLRRDYVQRMIDEFARVVGRALGLNQEGRREDALRLLQESYSTFFNEDAKMIALYDSEQLLKKLISEDGFSPAQIEIFAGGLRAEADMLLGQDPAQAKDRYLKALALYEYVEHSDASNYSLARRYAIEEIRYSISAL